MDINHVLLILIFSSYGICEFVKMKIVDEITNYGYNAFAGPDLSASSLKPKVKPANFSGPSHLKRLQGKCFSLQKTDYKYDFCPFDNVTQHEKTYRWNPYSGILGIWKEWSVVNHTFNSMIMGNGDNCGSDSRETKVILKCGTANNLTEVNEPVQCKYEMIFETPLVCHEDSLLVYPRMNESLRKEWDNLEQQLHDKEITQKGYDLYLRRVLWKAGFVSSPSDKSKPFKPFVELDTCNEEYRKLLEEVQRLRKEVKQKKR